MSGCLIPYLCVCLVFRSQKESDCSPVQSCVPELIPSPTSPRVSECSSPWTQSSPTQVSAPCTESQRGTAPRGRCARGQRDCKSENVIYVGLSVSLIYLLQLFMLISFKKKRQPCKHLRCRTNISLLLFNRRHRCIF